MRDLNWNKLFKRLNVERDYTKDKIKRAVSIILNEEIKKIERFMIETYATPSIKVRMTSVAAKEIVRLREERDYQFSFLAQEMKYNFSEWRNIQGNGDEGLIMYKEAKAFIDKVKF